VRGGEGFDLVECTDWGLFFVPWLLDPSSPPLVVRFHGSDGQIAYHDPDSCSPLFASLCQLIESALLPRAALRVTYSQSNQRAWSSQLLRNVEFCPPSLCLDAIHDSSIPSNTRGLVVGRVQKWKGPDTLCRALQLLGTEAPFVDWIGRSVNTTPTGQSYVAHLKKSFPDVWGSRICHLPPETPIQIKQRQSHAGFVLVPSEWDVFNFTAAEAMGRQSVVICSTGAGASELIDHGVNGFLFDAGDAQNLAAVIQQVQALSSEQRSVIGRRARTRVAEMLDPNEIARITIEQFTSAMHASNAPVSDQDLLRAILSPANTTVNASSAMLRSLASIDLKILLQHIAFRLGHKVLNGFRR
ncbi:MAG: glycosyltransferase, partial [Leptolyngbyaceae bacterium]|nr:glycosyltransferase [Leptolyngbyaceae bacterium]